MDEITMFASLRPEAPDDAELNEMRAGARRRFAATAPGRSRWRRARMPVLAGGLTAAVAGGAAAAVVLASGGTPAPDGNAGTVVTAAWTVKENVNGTVTVAMRQFAHPAQLQKVLRGDGINAYVRQLPWTTKHFGHTKVITPTCIYAHTNEAPQAVQQAVVTHILPLGWTINPAAMPSGSALFLSGGPITVQGAEGMIYAHYPVVLNSDKLPACVPFTPPPPPSR